MESETVIADVSLKVGSMLDQRLALGQLCSNLARILSGDIIVQT